MTKRLKFGRNDPCPCWSGKKYKHCCLGNANWNELIKAPDKEYFKHLSIRGRNIQFITRILEILQLDSEHVSNLIDYKKAFTDKAVREIHEAIIDIWPPDLDIVSILEECSEDVTGLYLGDYRFEYLIKGIIRHSIYANKILVVDPFMYAPATKNEFNPVINPTQHRSQTLKLVNFWLSMTPWIDSGLIGIIRTPDDFDSSLKVASMKRTRDKFENNQELKDALEKTQKEIGDRHTDQLAYEMVLLKSPDAYLKKVFEEANLGKDGYTFEQFRKHIQRKRDENPNFLEPIKMEQGASEFHYFTSGANYEIGQLTASITKSYLVTDLHSRWKEIELDREQNNVETRTWSPFAKSIQEAPFRYLDNVSLEHALKLRSEGRLERLRSFLLRVWKQARTESEFDEANALLFAEELRDEVAQAESEWKEIDDDILKMIQPQIGAGLLAAGPLISTGYGQFLAAAGITGGAMTLAISQRKRRKFPDRFPAAFFMNIKSDSK